MKKLILILTVVAMLICALAISVSAAEPDTTKESVTLSDGTVCPIWDTEGNPLIWYVTGTTDGVKSYDYVVATSEAVDYNGGHSDKTDGITWYQLSNVTINANGNSYPASSIAVFNIKSSEVKITSGKNIGQHINCMSKVFTSSQNLEYVYFPLDMIDINGENFKSCKLLKFANIEELTELREIGSQDFNIGDCKNLFAGRVLDLSNTKIKKLDQGALACVAATEIILPETLVDVGQWSFQNCKNATKITFLGDITSMNTNAIFNGCNSLVEVVGFKLSANATSIGGNAFKDCYALKNAGDFIVDGILTIPEGIKEIGTFAFTNADSIEAIVLPSTITKVYQQGFSYMDSVKIVSFDAHNKKVASGEKTSGVEFNNCGHFRGLTNLVAFTLPLNSIEASNRMLADCTNLTAVYMPNTIKYLASNGSGQGPFCNSPKMYFVQDIFTVGECIVDGKVDLSKLELPEKPSVYFMPSALTTFGGHVESNQYSKSGTLFQNCTSLNDVIVFGENFVNFNANNAFDRIGTESLPKTIVFLGDIQSYVTNQNAKYISFVFANKNDKTPSDLGITHVYKNNNNDNSYMYFCATNSKYDYHTSSSEITDATAVSEYVNALVMISEAYHVTDPNKESEYVDADCVNNSGVVEYCFCGAVSKKIDEENTALGHEFNVENGAKILSIVYANYFNYGDKTTKCARCDVNEETKASPIIIDFKGYSTKEDGDGITFGYYVDEEALVLFENVNEIKLEFGFVVAVKNFVVGDSPLNADGTVAETTRGSVVKAVASSKTGYYTGYDFKLTGAWNKMVDLDSDDVAETDIKDVQFYMAGYVFDGAVSYIQSETETSSTVSAFTYNDIK